MLTPKILLSPIAREQCIAKLKQLPSLVPGDIKQKQHAAVLVSLCVHNGDVCLLYTLRSSNLKSHSGQVAFPGGKMDASETAIETALRETEEEIGVQSAQVDIWDVMPPVQGRNSELYITPVVGVIRNFDSLILKPSVDEVEEIFTVPMKTLCDRNTHAHCFYKQIPLPIFLHEKFRIWGITGMITHFFLQSFLPGEVYKPNFMRKSYNLDELMSSKL